MVKKTLDDKAKKIARQAMKNNQKNWMKNLELLSLTSRSIEKCQPKRKTQNEEIIKLNKKNNHYWNLKIWLWGQFRSI